MNIFLKLPSLVPLFIGIVALVIIDTSISNVSSYIIENSVEYNTAFFYFLLGACGYCQYKTLKVIKEKSNKFSLKKPSSLYVINIIIPVICIFVLLLIAVQMYTSYSYHSILVKIILWASYGLAIGNMMFLSFSFFRWLQFNKNHLIIAYFISIVALSINLITALIAVTKEQFNEVHLITSIRDPVVSISSNYDILNSLYDSTTIASFILLWVSSMILLFHYKKKYGPVLFGMFFFLPLIYFVGGFVPFFSTYFVELSFDYPDQAQIIYTFIINSGKPIAGFLFGLVFWIASRRIPDKLLRDYLIIAGYGVMLIFTSNQVMSLISLDYPPFGIITVSFLCLASFLLFIGLYSSSIYVAQDRKLRDDLRRSKERQQNLMNQIGSAHMERFLIKTAEKVMKKMTDATGVEHVEDEDDYKKFIEEAVKEIQKEKNDK